MDMIPAPVALKSPDFASFSPAAREPVKKNEITVSSQAEDLHLTKFCSCETSDRVGQNCKQCSTSDRALTQMRQAR